MIIKEVLIEELSPHPLNCVIYEEKEPAEDLLISIERHGIIEPPVITEEKIIISGHRRLQAAKKLGFPMVKCRVIPGVADSPELEERLIEFNRQRVKTAGERLREIKHLQSLHSVGQGKRSDLDTSVNNDASLNGRREDTRTKVARTVGLSTGNVSKLLFIDRIDPGLVRWIDEGTASINQAYKQAQKINQRRSTREIKKEMVNYNQEGTDGSWRIVVGDSRNIDLGDVQASTIITSPPYWALRDYEHDGQIGREATETEFVDEIVGVFNHFRQYLKDDGSLFVELGESAFNNHYSATMERFVIKMIDSGWFLRERIVLNKQNWGSNRPNTWVNTCCFLYFFSKTEKYRFDRDRIRRPYNGKRPPRPTIYKKDGGDINKIGTVNFPHPDGRPATNIITVHNKKWVSELAKKTGKNFNHPAAFSPEVGIEPIMATTDPGDLVIDCFSGSGTTGITCLRLNRRYLGVELNEDFADLSRVRLTIEEKELIEGKNKD